jgi:hypothetical protein
MKKILALLSTVAFLGAAGIASAEEASGVIQTVDPAARTLQLEDGTIFMVSEGVPLEELQPGTEVTVSYEETDGNMTATSVTPVQ